MAIEKKLMKNFYNLIFLLIIFITYSIATGSIQTKSFPLLVNIESRYYVKSSMYLRYSFEEYNEPFAEFKAKENSPVANQFKKILQSIRDSNTLPPMVLSTQTQLAKGYQATDVFKQAVNSVNRYFTPAMVGQDFNKMRVIKQVYINSDRIIQCAASSETNERPHRSFWKFKSKPQDRNDFVWEVGMASEIENLMYEPFKPLEGVESLKIVPIDNIKCNHEYAIPGTTEGYPVYLQFNGKVCDFNVIDGVAKDEVLAFYQQTCHLLAQNPESLVNLYTEKSAQKYSSIMEKYPKVADPYLRQKEIIRQGRRVIFLLNADPVFIVFYQTFKGKMKFPENVRYDYIIRDPKDNQLRLANYSYHGLMSQFFDNKNLFIEPFLKPLLSNTKVSE